MDKREYISDPEEMLRVAFAGMMRDLHFATPCVMAEDTKDGHRCTPMPSVQRSVTDPVTGDVTYEDHPIAPDTVIHYAGGKKVVATHPVGKGDEGLIVYADRALDVPMQQGGTGQPIDTRQHHPADGTYIPGIRSDPKKLAQVDNDAHHVRSVDKTHVRETHPDRGHRTFSADPSTAPASATFDPLTMASKFVDHAVQGAKGLLARAVTGGTTHDHGIDFGTGPFMRAANALHTMLCHAQNGPSMNALNGVHQVLAHSALGAILSSASGKNTVTATLGGIMLQSPTSISLACPPGGLGLPAGGVGSSSLAPGAASTNVGTVGGDLTGTLPNPTVTGLHVDFSKLPAATSDAAAAAAGVIVGGLYRDTSVASGKSVLVVRMA